MRKKEVRKRKGKIFKEIKKTGLKNKKGQS
jgi:hypothetical protein